MPDNVLKMIKEDHAIILRKVKELRESKDPDFNELLTILERHKNIEERLVYPEYDKVLTDTEKEEVYWKLRVK